MKFFCCFAILLACVAVLPANAAPTAQEKLVFDQLNQERQKSGLPPLQWNDQVAEAARKHSRELAKNGKLSHQFPGEAAVPERIGTTGARFTLSAENVARTEYIQDVHPALMNSPGHRANMLNPKYNAVGIGVVERDGRFYVTQDFVFIIQAYTEEQFAAAFVETFNDARKTHGMRRINIQSDSLLHDLACSTQGDANVIAAEVPNAHSVVVFTASEPHQLPEQLLGRVANPDFRRMEFGVCYRPDQEHGYANFWVTAAFMN
ncbi:MAG TPA: CAP domain-containing protein [Candidatus Angelobacter sp.]|nr:CAP domain-containing protein [Candidatus Angelobacter sp.]